MFTAGLLAPWSQASCVHLQDSLSCKLGAPFIAKAIVTLHWHNAGPAYKPCHELRHKVRGVTLFNCLSKETAELWRYALPEFGLKLSSVLHLLSNCFANEAHPGTISKSLYYICSFLQAKVSEPPSLGMHMCCTKLT